MTSSPNNKKILITGSAGFIGFHLSNKFLNSGWSVVGLDALTDYYDKNLKLRRNSLLKKNPKYSFNEILLEDDISVSSLIKETRPSIVVHLAAQAGIRHSLDNPKAYFDSNLVGTFNLLESIKNIPCSHLMIASSSSVYGNRGDYPFKETDPSDHPISFYAATKKAIEVISHSYSHLYEIPTTCFRFFTVYGPWGRPDMALFKFTKNILNNKAIDVFGYGKMKRDFTYIDDLVISLEKLSEEIPSLNISLPESDSLSKVAPWRVVNLGNSAPKHLSEFLDILEHVLGKKAKRNYIEKQPGDVTVTYADISLLKNLVQYVPSTNLEKGIKNFVEWYKSYYYGGLNQ